jgi:hypothetical protein
MSVEIWVRLFRSLQSSHNKLASTGGFHGCGGTWQRSPPFAATERLDNLVRETLQRHPKFARDSASESAAIVLVRFEAGLAGLSHTIYHHFGSPRVCPNFASNFTDRYHKRM